MRSIALPSIGDPFLLHLWFSLSYPNFRDEIDHVYVSVDPKEKFGDPLLIEGFDQVKKHIADIYGSMPNVTVGTGRKEGIMGTIENAYHMVPEGLFGYIQEDAFVYRHGEIGRMFNLLESDQCDVVATPMYCYSGQLNSILSRVTENIHEPYLNEIGYAFWQNFFFADVNTIYETDLNFDVMNWPIGTYIPYLKTTMLEEMHLDGMASISFQLRVLKNRFYYVPQMLSVIDPNFDLMDVCHWQHVNSLSNIFNFMANGIERRKLSDGERIEYERRVAWWEFALDHYPEEQKEVIAFFHSTYRKTVDSIKDVYNLRYDKIIKRKEIIRRLFNI